MVNIKKQRGMSITALSVVLAVIGVFSLVAIKVIPIYMENAQIVSAMTRLVEKSKQEHMSTRDVRNGLRSRFSIDNISIIGANDIDVEVTPSGDVSLYLEYEDRVVLFGNIDLIVSFEKEID